MYKINVQNKCTAKIRKYKIWQDEIWLSELVLSCVAMVCLRMSRPLNSFHRFQRHAHEQAKHGKTRQDKRRQDKTIQNKTRQDKIRHSFCFVFLSAIPSSLRAFQSEHACGVCSVRNDLPGSRKSRQGKKKHTTTQRCSKKD